MRFELNLKQLKVFYFVAKYLSFTRAAEELFVTQPAVTKQVEALERHCGLRLFSRAGHKLELTEAGRMLYSYAERLMQLAFQAEKSVVSLRTHPGGILRLGTTKTWARCLMPAYFLKYQKLYPNVRIQLDVGSSEQMAESVVAGKEDVAIVGRVRYDDSIIAIPFPRREIDELIAVVPPGHRLAGRSSISLKELCDDPILMREAGSSTRRVIMERAEANGVQLNVVVESGSPEFIKDFVKGGAGISVVSRLLVEDDLKTGELIGLTLDDGGLWIQLDLLLLRDAYRSVAVQSFLEFLGVEAGIEVPD